LSNKCLRNIILSEDVASLSKKVADAILELISNVPDGASFSLAISGGNTPQYLYKLLSAYEIPWHKVHIFWVDDRFVPFDSPGSNYGAAVKSLISKIKVPPQNVHPIPFMEGAPDLASEKYEDTIRRHFGAWDAFPAFDLIILGIGEDGHTASLFPNSPLLDEQEKAVGVTICENKYPTRISLTFPVLNKAKNTFFLVSGQSKRKALLEILGDKPDKVLPARLVKPEEVSWYITEDAWE